MKVVINEKHINALDISLVRNIILLFTSYPMIKATGLSFHVNENQRMTLVQRSIAGTTAFTAVTFGFALVPLLVQ